MSVWLGLRVQTLLVMYVILDVTTDVLGLIYVLLLIQDAGDPHPHLLLDLEACCQGDNDSLSLRSVIHFRP
jgi:hypothetical protein